MNILINSYLCIECGLCSSICPNIFVYVDNKLLVIENNCTYEQLKRIKSAELSCPCDAISVIY